MNGCVYAKVVLRDGPKGGALHTFSTHLQSDNQGYKVVPGRNSRVRKQQVLEIAELMERVTRGSNDSVVLCGDLNVDPRNPSMREEYESMLHTLGMIDLWERFGPRCTECTDGPRCAACFPVTLGEVELGQDGVERPAERHLTGPSDLMSKQCVDFVLFRQGGEGSAVPANVRADFLRVDGLAACTQLSDHAAVVAEFILPA